MFCYDLYEVFALYRQAGQSDERSTEKISNFVGRDRVSDRDGGGSAWACPFCAKMTRTMTDEIRDSDGVVYGSLERISAESAGLTVEKVIRTPAWPMPAEIPVRLAASARGIKRVVFLSRRDERWVVNRLDSMSAEGAEYLAQIWLKRQQPATDRLAFFFARLDSSDGRIATDAYAEFAKASYRSTRQASKNYDPERIRRWIDDPRAAPERVGLYGLLLGLAGRAKDAAFLVSAVDSPTGVQINGLDGLLAGLYLIDPRQGRERITRFLVSKESSSLQRSSALSTLRFVLADVPPTNSVEWLREIEPALDDAEIAGPLVDEYRKAEVWDAGERILPLFEKLRDPSSVIRFALATPMPEGAALVGADRIGIPFAGRRCETNAGFREECAGA